MSFSLLVAAVLAGSPVLDTPSAIPPKQFRYSRQVDVAFVEDPSTYPGCEPAPGFVSRGCFISERQLIIMPNPCNYPKDYYARVLCHELGHRNGWTHPKAGPAYDKYVKDNKLIPSSLDPSLISRSPSLDILHE